MAPPKLFKDAVVVLSGTFPGHKHGEFEFVSFGFGIGRVD